MIYRSMALGLSLIVCCSMVARADIVTDWNSQILEIVAEENQTSPEATRALAMVHATIFDAVNSVSKSHQPYRFQRNTPSGTSIEAAAAQAGFEIAFSLYPGHLRKFEALLNSHLNAIPAGPARNAGVDLGRAVARDMIAWRATDGARRFQSHTPSFVAGQWRRTPTEFRDAQLPQWASMVPFAMTSPSEFRQPAPPEMTSPTYTKDFEELVRLGGHDTQHRTTAQTETARFWADSPGSVTLPGRWNQTVQSVALQQGNNLVQNARLFALLNIAMADATIAAWDTKYHHNAWRPVSAVRAADTDRNPATQPILDWSPLLETPALPGGASVTSSQSAAAAWVVMVFYNNWSINVVVPGHGNLQSRRYREISEAAREAGRSGVFGGVYFNADHEQGLKLGENLTHTILLNMLSPIEVPREEPPAPVAPAPVTPAPAQPQVNNPIAQTPAPQPNTQQPQTPPTQTGPPTPRPQLPAPTQPPVQRPSPSAVANTTAMVGAYCVEVPQPAAVCQDEKSTSPNTAVATHDASAPADPNSSRVVAGYTPAPPSPQVAAPGATAPTGQH